MKPTTQQTRYKRQNFRNWWKGMQSHPYKDRKKLMLKWMRFASKTVAMRGDQNQQKVVYTIYNRSFRSKYEIPKYNAKLVYDIVNAKQNKHREETAKLVAMRDAILAQAPLLRKTVKKKHVAGSNNRPMGRTSV